MTPQYDHLQTKTKAVIDHDAHQATITTSCKSASHANATLQNVMQVGGASAHRTPHSLELWTTTIGLPCPSRAQRATLLNAADMHASFISCALIG
jgi:hypothetical protein